VLRSFCAVEPWTVEVLSLFLTILLRSYAGHYSPFKVRTYPAKDSFRIAPQLMLRQCQKCFYNLHVIASCYGAESSAWLWSRLPHFKAECTMTSIWMRYSHYRFDNHIHNPICPATPRPAHKTMMFDSSPTPSHISASNQSLVVHAVPSEESRPAECN
jgi:hypothetical protein